MRSSLFLCEVFFIFCVQSSFFLSDICIEVYKLEAESLLAIFTVVHNVYADLISVLDQLMRIIRLHN